MMHCLAGTGHQLASGARYLGEPEFDGAAFASGAFFSTRLNNVGQTFDRRLAAIDYKATRQQLHREDFRDLIALTTKRMDIYHLVGTLFLTFVMSWYTDSTMWDLPVWFSDLFIISNYSAIGYLIMTVWMAMYASIAARSIGTRLLTSYARISLPTQAELDAIQQPVIFNVGAAKEAAKGFIKKKLFKSNSDPDLKALSGIDPDISEITLTFLPGDTGMTLAKGGRRVKEVDEDSQAAKKGVKVGWKILAVGNQAFKDSNFENAQKGDKAYEVTFDQNEVIITFKPGRRISMIDDNGVRLGSAGIGILLGGDSGDRVRRIRDGSQAQEEGVKIGWQILAINDKEFSEDVFEHVQEGGREFTIKFGQATRYVYSEDHNQHFRLFLEQLPQWLVYDTWSRVCLSFGMNQLLQALSYFSLATLWPKSPLIAIMSFAAVNFLAHLVLWFDVGDQKRDWHDELAVLLLHVLPASSAVVLILAQSLFPRIMEGERYLESVLVIMCFFLHAGWLWYLVTVLFANAGDKSARFQPATFANVLEWIPESKKIIKEDISHRRPLSERLGRRGTTKTVSSHSRAKSDVDLQKSPTMYSREDTDNFEGEDMADCDCFGDTDDCCGVPTGEPKENENGEEWQEEDQRTAAEIASEVVGKEQNGGKVPGVWMQTDRAHCDAKVDLQSAKHLPVKLLRLFTQVTIAWWVVAGLIHSAIFSFHRLNSLKDFTGSNNMAPLSKKFIQWPQPASLFKVSGLYCDNSQVLVNSGFSVYTMSQASGALSFVKEGNVGSVICGAHRCNTLSPPDGAGSWVLGPLQPLRGEETQVTIPHMWRQVAGAWMNCPSSLDAACASARIAGWDGSRVVVASLLRGALDKAWQAHPQFEVDPGVGLCAEHPEACDDGPREYKDVRALHMSENGHVLMILLGSGLLDVWDLSKGIVGKRMQLGSNFTSMCQTGNDVYLSREDGSSPIMETTSLPADMIELLHGSSSPAVAFPQKSSASKLAQNDEGLPQKSTASMLAQHHQGKRVQRQQKRLRH